MYNGYFLIVFLFASCVIWLYTHLSAFLFFFYCQVTNDPDFFSAVCTSSLTFFCSSYPTLPLKKKKRKKKIFLRFTFILATKSSNIFLGFILFYHLPCNWYWINSWWILSLLFVLCDAKLLCYFISLSILSSYCVFLLCRVGFDPFSYIQPTKSLRFSFSEKSQSIILFCPLH